MNDPLRALRALAIKEHVSLGGLPAGELALALAVVHATLPPERPMSEREINEALKAALAGAPTTSSCAGGSSTPAGWCATASAASTGR